MYGPPPQCLTCKHWSSPLDRTDADAQTDEPTQTCAAFALPAGIPAPIWTNQVDHRVPYDGDGGTQWEALNEMTFPDWAMASTS